MTTLFIADLHLSPERPAVCRAFLDFLEQRASQADVLYILGDLFEAWIGDDDPSAMARQVIAALRQLTDTGTEVYFQPGNRDFLVGKRFCRETGAVLLPDEYIAQVNDKPMLLMHGDTLCLDDEAYQKFRSKVRKPFYMWILAHLPLKKRLKIASDWRQRSMAANSNKASTIMDVSPEEVIRLLGHYGVDTLIHGHTHRPAAHPLKLASGDAQRLVLGDWGKLAWAIVAENDKLELQSWEIVDNN
jgi:UDP-2,3-diacylglucosamine hydrolase